jgi:glutamate racemase
VSIVDASDAVAACLRESLAADGLLAAPGAAGKLELLATDGVERFARVGATFLGRSIRAQDVRLVDL